jgi:hypothetical protein
MKKTRRRPKQSQIPFRNRSPDGWWVTEYVECFEPADADRRKVSRRCLAWLNTMIFQAKDREEAYRKAVSSARVGNHVFVSHGKKIRRRYIGLTTLMPIYEEIGDWAEVLWEQQRGVSFKRVQSWVKKKHELEVFDDSAP